MKRVHIMPALASLLFAAACGEDGPTAVDTRPSVRFVNATTGMTGSGGFTTNGQFAAGSALASGQATQTCSTLDAGTTSFGFGAANTGGTGLSGDALATSASQNLAAGGSYIVVATGSATSPALFVFGGTFSGQLGTDQAAVRFTNLAPTTGTTVYNYVFYRGEIGTTPLVLNMAFGLISTYSLVTSGANTFSVLQVPGNTTVVSSSAATLEPASVNTMALVRTAAGGLELMHIPGCS
jgi:hypothetical protein